MIRFLFLLFIPIILFSEQQPLLDLNINEFDVQGNQVFLKGGVQIEYEQDRITVDDEIQVELKEEEGNPEIRSLTSLGRTEFVRMDSDGDPVLILLCYGKAKLDQENNELLMEKGDSDKQICVKDLEGKIYADRLYADFVIEEGKISPTKLLMEGDVRIYHRFPGFSQAVGSAHQYALADKITYDPSTQVILISAVPKNRVLFVDQLNHLRMSAPAIRIHRDSNSGKEVVQGVGDVRLRFKKEEMDRMNLYFPSKEEA